MARCHQAVDSMDDIRANIMVTVMSQKPEARSDRGQVLSADEINRPSSRTPHLFILPFCSVHVFLTLSVLMLPTSYRCSPRIHMQRKFDTKPW